MDREQLRFGDLVILPKTPKRGVCVVINVHHSLAEGTVVMLRTKYNSTFFTRATNCKKKELDKLN